MNVAEELEQEVESGNEQEPSIPIYFLKSKNYDVEM